MQARGTVAEYQALEPNGDTLEWEALEEAYNLLDQLADEATECDCGGVHIRVRGLFMHWLPRY